MLFQVSWPEETLRARLAHEWQGTTVLHFVVLAKVFAVGEKCFTIDTIPLVDDGILRVPQLFVVV